MTKLYLTYDESSHGGQAINPEDSWPEYEDEYKEFYPTGLFLERKSVGTWMVETIEIDDEVEKGDTVYLVIARYTSGGTFSTTHGYWDITGSFVNEEEAELLVKNINKDPGFDYGGYSPWLGYFEHLESIDVHSFTVQ